MPEFSVNTNRQDPYKNCRFQIFFGASTTPVAAVSTISGLSWSTEVVAQKDGASQLDVLGIGRTTFAPVVLTRGLTQDMDFANWARSVLSVNGGSPSMSLANARRDVRLHVLNEEGQPVIGYVLHRCWPSHYQPLSGLDANDTATLFESLTLQVESFERDTTIVEIKET